MTTHLYLNSHEDITEKIQATGNRIVWREFGGGVFQFYLLANVESKIALWKSFNDIQGNRYWKDDMRQDVSDWVKAADRVAWRKY